ncbi:blastula protease 10-like [Amphiura filiformis]|uniref:blastula protease 10-like n=1 Tax=Amphiura filiformis TaxID=82378 RepID=UPI003B21CCCB
MRVFVFSMMLAIFSLAKARSLLPHGKFQDPFNKEEPPEEKASSGMFQSDMKLTSEQRAEIEEGMRQLRLNGTGISKRKATSMLQYLWPGARIPYKISLSSAPDTLAIQTAMYHWEEHTCIRFHERTQETDYINFIREDGCWSNVGRIGGRQDLSIDSGCAGLGTIAHEIGHVLGFHHEQTRPDRDNYVRVHYDNIDPTLYVNFYKYSSFEVVTHQIPYDYGSVMHYGPYYFSTNDEPTITADSPLDQIQMGNREGLSFADIKLANAVYGCGGFGDACDHVSISCLHDGYLGPDCTCICPPGYSGTMCEVIDEDTGCIKEVTDITGVIESPNYPGNYGNYDKCLWYIKGSEGSAITLSFETFSIEEDETCDYDWVQIRTEPPFINGGLKYCGINSPGVVKSIGSEMVVEFVADYLLGAPGFKASWVINDPPEPTTLQLLPSTQSPSLPPTTPEVCAEYIGCGNGKDYITDTCATIEFGPYNNLQTCLWQIQVPKGSRISLTFDKMDIQDSNRCKYDSLSVKISQRIRVQPQLCGKSVPEGPIVSTSNVMKLYFKSNRSGKGRGFTAHYKTVTQNP